jgi:iron complex transport system substrate-binding protein
MRNLRKIKKLEIILLAAMISVLTAGCVGSSAAVSGNADGNTVSVGGLQQNGEYTFTDDCGREVTVKSIERTASLLGSFSDVWLSSGGELVATVDETWTSVDKELGDSVINLGGIQNVNVELLIAAQPDFVIASANTDAHVQLKDVLEAAGICVAYFYVNTFDDYLRMLKVCTDLTGHTELYKTNGTDIQTQIEDIKKRVTGESPKILFLRAASSNVKAKASDDTVGTQILKDLGCTNIADSDSALKDNLSIEAIVQSDPDYIFVTTQGSNTEAAMANVEKLLTSNPVWSSLTAVKNNRYYILDKALYNSKPNARWAEAYLQLADILYP